MNKSQLLGFLLILVLPVVPIHATTIEIDTVPLSGITLELLNGTAESISLNGSVEYHVTFPFSEGSATDGDSNGREEVPAEMVVLSLTGTGTMGSVVIGLSTTRLSTGLIEEQVNNYTGILDVPPFVPGPSYVDSFFDVFFEIAIGGNVYHNEVPAHIAGVWSHKPSTQDEFGNMFNSMNPVALFDKSNVPTGLVLRPTPIIPIPSSLWLIGSGLLGLIGIARKKAS